MAKDSYIFMETIRPSDRETFKENGNGHHIGARNWLILLAPLVGLEPTTLRLTAQFEQNGVKYV